MMTGWMIAHRMAHAFSSEEKTLPAWKLYMSTVQGIVSNMLHRSYTLPRSTNFFTPPGETKMVDGLTYIASRIGTMKAARDERFPTVWEFAHDLLAQYLITGRVALKPPTPTFGPMTLYEKQIERALGAALQSAVGKIFLM
jgi:hypothetical protein